MDISGRVTKNATIREISATKSVVNFSIAKDDSYCFNKNMVKRTTFFQVGYWGSKKVAELVKLDVQVNTSAYIDKNGQPKSVLHFQPTNASLKILARCNVQYSQPAETNTIPVSTKVEENDDLPF